MQPTDLTAADRSQELFDTFKAKISAILKENLSDSLPKSIEDFNEERDSALIRKYSREWNKMYNHAKTLYDYLDVIKSYPDWEEMVGYINTAADSLRNRRFSDISGKNECVNVLTQQMSNLIEIYQNFRRFENSSLRVVDLNVTNALKQFVDTAKTIVTANDYSTSNLKKLDDLLADTEQSLKDNFAGLGVGIVSTRSFVAIAAPSMEGKTQAAFTLRRVKPLYFSLSETGSSGDPNQSIYRNFSSLSQRLCACARADVDSIVGSDEALKITTGSLDGLRTQKFWTVGFLVALVTNCSLPAAGSNESWMGNYAKVKDFYFSQLSINEIPKNHFKDICIFLDEYVAEPWAIFVRNLARVSGIKCVCSNTNTKIANIVGKNDASGSEGAPIRSIVITRLNSPCLPFLDETHKLTESINAIKSAALRNQISRNEFRNPVCRFLNDFKDIQLKCLRPGAAVYIAKALRVLATTETVRSGNPTLGWLLDFMMGQLASDLSSRKERLTSEPLAFLAKIGLMVPQSYFGAKDNSGFYMRQPKAATPALKAKKKAPATSRVLRDLNPNRKRKIEDVESGDDEEAFADMFERLEIAQDVVNDRTRKEGFSHQKMFLEHHLYYLMNPQIEDMWMFLTFSPVRGKNLRTFFRGFRIWKHEFTYFETDELLTMLSCLSIPSYVTISTLLDDADESIYGQPKSIANNPNPRAMAHPGNPLELTVAVSVADASQHSFGTDVPVQRINFLTNVLETVQTREYSFRGQDGCTFVKNLIVNLIVDEEFDYNADTIDVQFFEAPEFNLEADYLNKCRIPYLYSLNRSIPLLNELSNPSTDFLVDRYIRTGDHERIDGRFKFLLDGEVGRAVIECKHYGRELTPAHLKVILCKAFETKNAMLSLIFCPQATESPDETYSFRHFCLVNEINAFRVIKTQENSFQVVPLLKTLPLFENPEFVCILFELKRINERI